ncbi:hypothetical protein [Burkholderia pseudomallei]|uniref:hypothetical protein n=1 Tax=Burkholderia pseudomallei TaxID=28450 RepID=UPI0018C47480|nr:hypothetical protein [Burkholderia pseudomallei]MBG1252213.1 hypothetical protein [Burkholderia pseudomallei]
MFLTPLLAALRVLPWRVIAVAAVAAALFIGGCHYGASRVTEEWQADKVAIAQAAAKQAAHAATVNAQELTINREISHEFQQSEKALAESDYHFYGRVRIGPAAHPRHVPRVSAVAAGTAASAANAIPATPPTGPVNCERLAQDAAQTTLMLVELQEWYHEQAALYRPDSDPVSSERPDGGGAVKANLSSGVRAAP